MIPVKFSGLERDMGGREKGHGLLQGTEHPYKGRERLGCCCLLKSSRLVGEVLGTEAKVTPEKSEQPVALTTPLCN